MKEKKEEVKGKKEEVKEKKSNERPHFVLEVQDAKVSNKNDIGKGDK